MTTPLIEELVRRGRLDSDQAGRIEGIVLERGGTLDTNLIERNWVDESTILSAMGAAFGIAVASPGNVRSAPDAGAVRAFPEQWARKHMLAPLTLDQERGELSVLAVPPPDPAVLEKLSGMLELRVVPLLTTEMRVHERLGLLYGAPVPERYQALLTPSRRPSLSSGPTGSLPPRNSDQPLDNSLRDAITKLRESTSRDVIIDQVLARARRDFAFSAFFVVTEDKITGRAASGLGSESIQKVSVSPTGRSAFATAVRNQAHVLGPLSNVDQKSLSVLGRLPPRTALIIPVRVRDRTVGLIYADQGDHTVSPRAASDLMLFVNAMGSALEGLVMRKKGASVVMPPPEATTEPNAQGSALRGEKPTAADLLGGVPPSDTEPSARIDAPAPALAEDLAQLAEPSRTSVDAAQPIASDREPPPGVEAAATPEPAVPVAPEPAVAAAPEPAAPEPAAPEPAAAAVPEPAAPEVQAAPAAPPEPARAPTLSDEGAWAMGVPASQREAAMPKPRKGSRFESAIEAALSVIDSPDEAAPPERAGLPVRPAPWSAPPEQDWTTPVVPDEDTDKIRRRQGAPSGRPAISGARMEALPVPPLASEVPSAADLAADLGEPLRRGPIPSRVTNPARRSLAPAPAAPDENRSAWENHVSTVWAAFAQPPAVAPLMPTPKHSMTPLPAEIVGDADSIPPPPPLELRRETWVKASARPLRASGDATPPPAARSERPMIDASARAIQGHIPVARGEPLPTEHSHVVTVSGRVEKKGAQALPSEPPEERTAIVTRTLARGDKLDYEQLLDRLDSVDTKAAAAARAALIEHGDVALPHIMRRFPGRLSFDPFGVSAMMPPLASCGPLLDIVAHIGTAAHAWVAERLDDPLPLVRLIAVHYYGTIRVPEALPRLTRRLHDEEPRVANLAVLTLGLYRDDRNFQNVLSHLHARLASPSANARRHAAKLLATLGDTNAVPLLAAMFDRKDKIVYDAVESALAELTKQRFGPSTKRWLQWWETHRKLPRAEWLLEGLDGPDADLRKNAADELRAVSGIDPGFLENGPKKGRDEAKKRWQEWWIARSRGRPTA